jgi:hypothetical protein
MIERAISHGLITGLGEDFVDGGVAVLQYADDTILLMQNSHEQARNLKFILRLFEQMSGLKINFHKSEVYCMGAAKERQEAFESIFACQSKELPMKYLGIPIDKKRIKNSDWNGPIGRIEKNLAVGLENACPLLVGRFSSIHQ